MAICIFVKGLWDVHTTAAKMYEKDHQTLSEVIRRVEKFNAAQQLTAMVTPSMVSMMPNNDRCFVCGQMGHFGYHCPNVQCYSCDEFGHFAQDCPNKIPSSGTPCHWISLIQGHNIPTPKGTYHTPPTTGTDRGDSSTDHNHVPVSYHDSSSSSSRRHTLSSSKTPHQILPQIKTITLIL